MRPCDYNVSTKIKETSRGHHHNTGTAVVDVTVRSTNRGGHSIVVRRLVQIYYQNLDMRTE